MRTGNSGKRTLFRYMYSVVFVLADHARFVLADHARGFRLKRGAVICVNYNCTDAHLEKLFSHHS